MSKRTHASVTEDPCTCGYLQNAADDPSNPIVFDAQTAEYQFSYGGAMLVIYHCPFCGGAAPESKRALLFEQIPDSEQARLAKLLDGIKTIDAAIKKLGKPDFDGTSTSEYPEQEDAAPRIEHHRDIRFHNLSDVAEIWLTERADGSMYWHLQGKYIGQERVSGTNCTAGCGARTYSGGPFLGVCTAPSSALSGAVALGFIARSFCKLILGRESSLVYHGDR